MFPHFGSYPHPYPPIPAHSALGFDPSQIPYPPPFPYPHALPHPPSIDVVLQGATPSTTQSTPDDRPSASDSHPDSHHAEQSASPSSPQQGSVEGSTAVAAPKKPRPRAAQRESWVPPPPPPPLSDPVALLQRSQTGLAQVLSQGNIDARPSRQGPGSAPRSGACTGCRAAKAKCSQDEPQCMRCLMMKLECVYPLFNKRGRKRTMTPCVPDSVAFD